jgi:serine/threonine protein kinase
MRHGQRVGRYELIDQLGAGGMAEVWRAQLKGAAGYKKLVALKMMHAACLDDPAFLTMFVDEAKLSSALTHPRIVETFDFGCIDDRYFLAMELVDGAALARCHRALRSAGRTLSPTCVAYIAAELAAALEYAHTARDASGNALSIVHRDVSPSNVLISVHGEVKLADFGIAKVAGRAAMTEAGSLKGKIIYMSPEQAWGRAVDGRSDLYSLGLVMYELLTNRRALDADSEIAVLENARAATIAPLGAVDPALAEITMRALAADPAQRYATAGALREALLVVLASSADRDPAQELGALVREVREHRAAVSSDPATDPSVATGTESGPTSPTVSATISEPAAPRRARRLRAVPIAALGSALLGAGFLFVPMLRTANDATASIAPVVSSPVAPKLEVPQIADPVPTPSVPVSTARPRLVEPAHAVASGSTKLHTAVMRVQVEPWGSVSVDGRLIGQTPLLPFEVTAGRHVVVARHPQLGSRSTSLTLKPDETRLVRLQLGGAN